MKIAFALLAALTLAPALAQAPAPIIKSATVRVVLTTSLGPITLELEKQRAPITTANFLRYIDQKRFDGITFYRASKVPGAPDFGFIQGGSQNDPKRTLPPIAHEPTSKTGVTHTDGTISMARLAPGTARGDFIITLGPLPYLDANPGGPGDNFGNAAFGHVVEGIDIVRRIHASPASTSRGQGPMKGEMLEPAVRVIAARRVPVAR